MSLNLIVVSEVESAAPTEPYTRESLGQTLSFMGCKQRHAFKVSQRVFDTLALVGGPAAARVQSQLRGRFPRGQLRGAIYKGETAFLTRPQLYAIVAWALAEYRYTKPDQVDDLAIACRRGSARIRPSVGAAAAVGALRHTGPSPHARAAAPRRHRRVRERRASVIVLLCGTSGTGKSTVAALLVRRAPPRAPPLPPQFRRACPPPWPSRPPPGRRPDAPAFLCSGNAAAPAAAPWSLSDPLLREFAPTALASLVANRRFPPTTARRAPRPPPAGRTDGHHDRPIH